MLIIERKMESEEEFIIFGVVVRRILRMIILLFSDFGIMVDRCLLLGIGEVDKLIGVDEYYVW